MDFFGQIDLCAVNQQRQTNRNIPQQPNDLIALLALVLQLFEQFFVLFAALPLGLVGELGGFFVLFVGQSLIVDVDFCLFLGGFLLAELVGQGMEQLHIVLVDKITHLCASRQRTEIPCRVSHSRLRLCSCRIYKSFR